MENKYELVLNGITWVAADNIEYNTIDAFQTSDSNKPVYYIALWKGNAYKLHEKYTCHTFDTTFIIPEGELFCSAKFMTPTRKTFYWYHEWDEAISVMVKLIFFVMPYIELIKDNNKKNKLPSRFKVYSDMNTHLLSGNDHQIILDKIEEEENHNHDEYVEDENDYNGDSNDSDEDDN